MIVFLSHSLYEKNDCLYFYDLNVETLNSSGCQELETERISSVEGIVHGSFGHALLLKYT